MRKLFTIVMLLCAGCSGGLVPTTRSDVDRACPNLTSTEVDAAIILWEIARNDGFSKAEATGAAVGRCEEQGILTSDACTCTIVLIDFVWGG